MFVQREGKCDIFTLLRVISRNSSPDCFRLLLLLLLSLRGRATTNQPTLEIINRCTWPLVFIDIPPPSFSPLLCTWPTQLASGILMVSFGGGPFYLSPRERERDKRIPTLLSGGGKERGERA